jgi:hypothetical protein
MPLNLEGFNSQIFKIKNGRQVICTNYPITRLYWKFDGSDWGSHLYCSASGYLVKEFNVNIGNNRTKTLMEGHECSIKRNNISLSKLHFIDMVKHIYIQQDCETLIYFVDIYILT